MDECYKCNYLFEDRIKPKSCPRCKARLDYVFKEKIDNKKETIEVQEEPTQDGTKPYISK